ncbi:oxidation resistance protein 1 [Clathrospora elynae]|uniref:Oxidation resistance protein 1 n=1 Tax=Clathrospora elynae TaxID=706981 RepID=A0A6A5S5N1_9PLEO|nr:oxidation resistance protein 1 [Clathrospora elynae]
MPPSTDTPSSSPPARSPPSQPATPNRSSSYFTYPVSYAMSGILRRLNSETSPQSDARLRSESSSTGTSSTSLQSQLQSTASSLSHTFASLVSSSTTSDLNAVYQPPYRTASPFQPPPLTPLSLKGWRGGMREKGKLLSKALAEEIRLLLPPRLQLVDEWSLAYSLEQNGVSLGTLYKKSDDYRGKRGGFVLVVKDDGGGVFGAYLSDALHPSTSFYGNGECFLWRAQILTGLPDLQMNLPPPPSADTTHAVRMTTIASPKTKGDMLAAQINGLAGKSGSSTPDRIRFKAFPYSGVNDYMIFCEHSYLSIGGGDGHYGLWLDDNLEKGVSDTCPTFGNEPLSDEGKKFHVMGVELWYIGS